MNYTTPNFLQVSQNGLDIISHMIDRLGSDFRPYLSTVIPVFIDRLGDSKEVVRERANTALCKLMDGTIQPQTLFEKMMGAFTHKNNKVREEILLLLQATLNAHGAGSLTISKYTPSIVTLISDRDTGVRDTAMSTLVEIYRYDAHFYSKVFFKIMSIRHHVRNIKVYRILITNSFIFMELIVYYVISF